LRNIKNDLERGNRRSNWISIEISALDLSLPEPLVELDDMIHVALPCHPEEPLKVDKAWEQEVACLVCGVQYPVDVVRPSPSVRVVITLHEFRGEPRAERPLLHASRRVLYRYR
jgi:hypothetical protein